MIFLPVSLLMISVLLLTVMSVVLFRHRRLSSVVFLGTAGYAFFAAVNSENLISKFSWDVFTQMSLIYLVGSVALSISVLNISGLIPRHKLSLPVWNRSDLSRHATFSITLSLASIVIIVLARGENIFANWSSMRESSGFLTALGTSLFMLSSPGIISSFLAKRRACCIILFFMSTLLFVILGSRAAFLGALLFGIWLMLMQARRGWTRLRVIAIALLVVMLIHTFLRGLRGFGIAGLLKAYNEGSLSTALFDIFVNYGVSLTGGESDIPEALMFSITQSSIDYFGFMTSIQRLILLPIPSIHGWISKPIDVTKILWAKAFTQGLFDGHQGQATLLKSFFSGNFGSMHPTIFGEYFVAGGWISLFLSSVVLGLVLVVIDYVMHRTDILTGITLCGPIIVGYLFVARGNSVIGLGYFVYLWVMVGLLRYIVKLIKKLCVTAIVNTKGVYQ